LPDGQRVYFAFPTPLFGSMAERTVVPASRCVSLPDALDDFTAAAAAGDVYIVSRSGSTVLLLFWKGNRALSPNERKAASAWLSAEGWFAYASGAIGDADQEVLKLIAEA
jgi:hypothetical protein